MILSANMLNDVTSVNSWEFADSGRFTQGDTASVYFRLVDATLDTPQLGFSPAGRRYIPAAGATLQVVVDNIDNAKKITRIAVNPFPDDRSIWKLDFLSSDVISGTASMHLTLTEGSVIRRGSVRNALRIDSQTGCVG